MSLRRRFICSAAALVAALALVPAGGARTGQALNLTHLYTYQCSSGEKGGFNHHLAAGHRIVFVVDHTHTRLFLELLHNVNGKWPGFWHWTQPDLWITGQYHIETYRAQQAGLYHVELVPLAALGTGGHSCTVQVYDAAG